MISYDDKNFYIDGKKTKIVSGAMHYFRIVPEYWQDRLLKLKEMGCNSVETYIPWNLHEKTEGNFDFSGALDFVKFLDMAKDMGLYAIVRPGPFICSEWDMGGLPWWLLKYRDVELRCSDERFLSLCTPYLERVCALLKPHLYENGGNVLFLQIENEYGSYGNDKSYLKWLRDFYLERGIDCPFITSDGETDFLLRAGSLPGVLASVNYRNESEKCVGKLKEFKKDQPGAVMELWNGIGMRWGVDFCRRNVEEVKESVKSALKCAELVNLYMFHGGTTFGFMNGALDFGKEFLVQMTSYDVDAPLDEYGRRTKKYYAEQEVICKEMGKFIENTAKDTELSSYKLCFKGECSLAESGLKLKKHNSVSPEPMEFFDQGYGYIVYETDIFVDEKGGSINLPEIHDVAHIYIDSEYKNTLERYSENKTLEVEAGEHHLSILVENLGRVNFGTKLKDYKGLVGNIVLHDNLYGANHVLFNFSVYSLPLEKLPNEYNGKARLNEPAFYKYEFFAEEAFDTVINFGGFTRGVAFINGINLGRHWEIENSENKLFIPGPFIKEGINELVVFDVLHKEGEKTVVSGEASM